MLATYFEHLYFNRSIPKLFSVDATITLSIKLCCRQVKIKFLALKVTITTI